MVTELSWASAAPGSRGWDSSLWEASREKTQPNGSHSHFCHSPSSLPQSSLAFFNMLFFELAHAALISASGPPAFSTGLPQYLLDSIRTDQRPPRPHKTIITSLHLLLIIIVISLYLYSSKPEYYILLTFRLLSSLPYTPSWPWNTSASLDSLAEDSLFRIRESGTNTSLQLMGPSYLLAFSFKLHISCGRKGYRILEAVTFTCLPIKDRRSMHKS